MQLTHINEQNHPKMVDIGQKEATKRIARASGKITMNKEAYNVIISQSSKKGPVLQTAIIAAIMGAKKTSDIIPMCHPLMLNGIDVQIEQDDISCSFVLSSSVKTEGKTGVEMEALSSVSIGLLTIYDMVKAIDKTMIISDIKLELKSGGKSGDYIRG
ncbi:cyclic pyranopterin monophosphate synthase MoaC [Helicobacter cappadocius]|uniref:Cyclic pyranopterin monophosphate synthase n=1 Tax=Helicobacter cappadocius TaxID=3063998 RepID=A0AA90PLQ7_9HELI|nr:MULTISPECIES: cyclic pyranopterin monophosphate synthase MoaC [unclassified Helicobacter]MDO7253556.1 cyclic pyranopterin monophosphate synthase MoaC [Helicobacter sp. faydin-H75]MDP2539484.1 cyclic pyranopterin monophosphate synthase MoaC [Helicobacter sp. faydin-H76]